MVPSVVSDTLRSFRHRNYRLFFAGQFVSMVGTWMQQTAQMWLVYRLTKDSFLLGLVGFAGQFPVVLLGLFGGLVADRLERRKVLIWTEGLAAVPALALGVLTITGAVQVWHIIVLSMFSGLVNAFDMPARQSFVFDIVEREDLTNAIALNSTLVNGSRILGPAVAGLVIAAWGEGPCFVLNALSFIALIAALLVMRIERAHGVPDGADAWHSVKQGLHYVATHRAIRAQLVLLAAVSFAAVPFMVLLPIFASDVLHRGPEGLGLLQAASGVGAVAGALWLAGRKGHAGLPVVIGSAAALFGASLICFAFSESYPLSLALMVLTGASMMMTFAGSNTLLQALTSDVMRGRVMSLFSMTFMGLAPLGSLAGGALAGHIGAPATVALGAAGCMASALAYARASTREAWV